MAVTRKKINGVWVDVPIEEQKQSEREGQAYIQQREQIAGQQGISSRQAAQQISAQTEAANPPGSVLAAQARQKLEQQAAEANVTQALLQQEIAKQNQAQNPQIPPQNQPQINPLAKSTPAQQILQPQPSNQEIPPIPEQKQAPFLSEAIFGMPPLEIAKSSIEGVSSVPKALSSAAQIYDLLKSSLTAAKSTDVKKAEAAFTDATFIMDKNIALVKSGQKSYSDAYRDFQLGRDSLQDLERTTKGLGRLNLRYWLDGGAEIEAQIIRERRIMENQEIELRLAGQTAQLNTARAGFGLPSQ